MDSATSLYRSRMRPFRDRPDIVIPGRWYWCPEGAKALPFAHAFLSYRQDSSTTEGLQYDLGELPEWHGLNTHVANSRYTGQHFCGTEEDWQKGAIYGQTIQLDAEGVPVCCQGGGLRPGGGAIVIKTPTFSLSQAIWWLNPDTLQGLADGDFVDNWVSSAGPPNDAICNAGIGTIKIGLGVTLRQIPPHQARNNIVPTTSFSLHQCSWYLVGGGAHTLLTQSGPSILGGPLPIAASFVDARTQLAVATNHHIASHHWLVDAKYGLFSTQFGNGALKLYLNGTLMAQANGPSTDTLRVDGFIKGPDFPSIFAGSETSFQEFILFDHALSDVDDYTVLSYLAVKYGFSLGPENTYFPPGYFPAGYWRPWYYPLPSESGVASRFFATGYFPGAFFGSGFFP